MEAVLTLARNLSDTLKASRLNTGIVTLVSGGVFVGLGLFALWVAACIVGGMIEAGGPLGFVKSWFMAAFEG